MTLTSLANLYRDLGKYTEAEEIYRRALNQEQFLGPEHAELVRPLLGLALLSYKQGKLAQAENLHQRVLRILEQLLGTEHYFMAFSLVGLANIARDQGQL
ncbi:hypothetical protein KSF_064800 [Reticulibacter mediterranei]|uniref:Tetratricopeptide repeat protein n=1 Tax=Reticulibacter mediterranei TaxID=2778369 RepID=A0A8J3ITB9_9CHLR|nr:tetratricopeptide repeat protein [Reticulibacter mediterranei]GHO96432.1 hypothetical protein KSF_064800 [Reticulibacter mediterranei]